MMLARQTLMADNSQATEAIPLRERLIVALDVPSVEKAEAVVNHFGNSVQFYKVGMQLQFAKGLEFAEKLINTYRKKVFLDSKLLDIGTTIEGAVANVAKMHVDFLTVHGNGKIIQAAVKGRQGTNLKILCVTVLTTLDAFDLKDLYGDIEIDVPDLVMRRARRALEYGADGVIASGQEAEMIRNFVGGKLRIIAPGIRPDGSEINDQKRVTKPKEAISAGADYLVVGRPILQSNDPVGMVNRIVSEISEGLALRSK